VATFTKKILSGSSDGRGIKVVQTATSGTTIHTGPTDTAHIDEVWLYAVNSDTTARKLTIEYGSTSSPDDLIELTIPPEAGLVLVVPGLPIKGNASALVVRAFCATANVVMIHGWVNTIS
jgi:hypothetical protein